MDIIIEDKGTHEMLEGLLKRLQHPEPLIKTLARYTRALTMQMFRGKRPDKSSIRGKTWGPLAEKTILQKRVLMKAGKAIVADRPLVRTGKLRDSLSSDSAIKIYPKGFSYGTNVVSKKGFSYPGFHQVGDDRVPARRWLFLRKEELYQMTVTTRDWIENKLKEMKA